MIRSRSKERIMRRSGGGRAGKGEGYEKEKDELSKGLLSTARTGEERG